MNEGYLDSCSENVRKALQYLDENTSEEGDHIIDTAPAFYALSRVESAKPNKFLYNFSHRWDRNTYVYEGMDRICMFSKIYMEIGDANYSHHEDLSYVKDKITSLQMERGDFSISDFSPGGPIWFLAQEGIQSPVIEKAIGYLMSNESHCKPEYAHTLKRTAINILALCDVDRKRYAGRIKQMGDELAETTQKVIQGGEYPIQDNLSIYPYVSMSLSSVPGDGYDINEDIVQELKACQLMNGGWKDDITKTGLAALALFYSGEGPKVPRLEVDRKMSLAEKDKEKSKAQFISTVPATRAKSRETAIFDRMSDIVQNAEKSLRISTLRIDLLYEEIIDRIEEDGLEVKIVTSEGKSDGPRSKLKKAAIDELVKRSEGNVKEDPLIHTRMVISDAEELIVSSADMTREQLKEEYNAGIYTRDDQAISSAIGLFDKMWENSDHREA